MTRRKYERAARRLFRAIDRMESYVNPARPRVNADKDARELREAAAFAMMFACAFGRSDERRGVRK